MDLFEYQAKELFAKHNVPTTPGRVTDVAADAKVIAEEIGRPVMVKAQVKAGGRGKAGGVKYAATPDDALTHAQNILGLDIKGHIVARDFPSKRRGSRQRDSGRRAGRQSPLRQAGPPSFSRSRRRCAGWN